MQDVRLLDTRAAELPGIGVVGDFEHVPVDVNRVACQERLNVVAVDALSPLGAKDTPDGLGAAQGSETHQPYWRMTWRTLGWCPPPEARNVAQKRAQHSCYLSPRTRTAQAVFESLVIGIVHLQHSHELYMRLSWCT